MHASLYRIFLSNTKFKCRPWTKVYPKLTTPKTITTFKRMVGNLAFIVIKIIVIMSDTYSTWVTVLVAVL